MFFFFLIHSFLFIRTSYSRLRIVFLFHFSEFEPQIFLFSESDLSFFFFTNIKKYFIMNWREHYTQKFICNAKSIIFFSITWLFVIFFIEEDKVEAELVLKCSYFGPENEADVLIKGSVLIKKRVYVARMDDGFAQKVSGR